MRTSPRVRPCNAGKPARVGMRGLERLPSRGPRQAWGIWSGKGKVASYGWLAARLNCPSAANESRTLKRSEWKSLPKAAANARGNIDEKRRE